MAITRADRITTTTVQDQIYSDFLTDMVPHPVSKDVLRFVNEHAVIRSIKNLVMTDRGERLYQPDLGSNIKRMMFEPMIESTAEILSQYIQETIDVYEPRAKVLDISVVPDYNNNLYAVTLSFMIINKEDPVTLNITLDRVR
jgi:phage baseplate assembly protein W